MNDSAEKAIALSLLDGALLTRDVAAEGPDRQPKPVTTGPREVLQTMDFSLNRRSESVGGLVIADSFVVGPECRAAIFDFDGTIAETYIAQIVSCRYAFERLVGETLKDRNWEKIFKQSSGNGLDATIEALQKEAETSFETRFAKSDFFRHRADAYHHYLDDLQVAPVPGVLSLIESLHQSGRTLAICTTSERAAVEPILRAWEIEAMFEALVTYDEVSADLHKPGPFGYTLACRRLGVRPDQAVAFEDTPIGAIAARSAHIRTCARFRADAFDSYRDQLQVALESGKYSAWPHNGPAIHLLRDWDKVEVKLFA